MAELCDALAEARKERDELRAELAAVRKAVGFDCQQDFKVSEVAANLRAEVERLRKISLDALGAAATVDRENGDAPRATTIGLPSWILAMHKMHREEVAKLHSQPQALPSPVEVMDMEVNALRSLCFETAKRLCDYRTELSRRHREAARAQQEAADKAIRAILKGAEP